MMNFIAIQEIFKNENIDFVGVLPFENIETINKRLLPQNIKLKSCIVFLVPYFVDFEGTDCDGISIYARSVDYHLYFDRLYEIIIPNLSKHFENESFYGYADHSPINEKQAAAKAGLGIIGKNTLLINKKYGSYVFIGSILTTKEFDYNVFDIQGCGDCRICLDSCPTKALTEKGLDTGKCLSGVSQKNKVNDYELSILKENNISWGCDICQKVCPKNQRIKKTPLPFFKENRLGLITSKVVQEMTGNDFQSRAFSYRSKNVIIRNLENLEK